MAAKVVVWVLLGLLAWALVWAAVEVLIDAFQWWMDAL